MPQKTIENSRMALRIPPSEKSLMMRAAALQQINLTEFVRRVALVAAQEVIEAEERIRLSEQGSQQILDLLDNPPEPNKRLLAAAFALPKKA